MAEFRKLPTQAELQKMLFMEQMRVKSPQEIAQEALVSGTTVTPIPENVFQKIAGGAGIAKEYVNRAGTAADIAKLFPGYQPQTKVTIPTGYNFAPKQAPTGEVIPGGLQTQNVNLGQVLQAIKPADVLGISGAERAYSDIGAGKTPQPLDVLDVAGLGATGLVGGKAALRATKGVPVGMSIQEAKGLLTEAPRSPLGFYSALEESALNLQRNKGSGQAFLNDLQKAPNVKADEIKWTGLDEFLKTKPNVTKQEVQDYLANNRVEVQEVRSTVPRLPGEEMPGDKGAFLPKFGSYTLPGGENYREILLTMPTKFNNQINSIEQQIKTQEEVIRQALRYGEENPDQLVNMQAKQKIAEEKINNLQNELNKIGAKTPEYKSAHFDQPNILAHLRVNDRVDADGKKMLLVEEVQSDWHQAGREKGYKNVEEQKAFDAALEEAKQYSKELREKYGDANAVSTIATVEEQNKYRDLFAKAQQLKPKSEIPDAPFKDSWYQLALKRAIQYAAENGYDRIGLTTGSQQAARFDLSKQLSRVSYQDGVLHGYDKSGALVMNKAVTPDELPNYVGKELGSKMAENAVKDAEIRNKISVARYERKPESEINALRSQLDDVKTDYAGLDLQVGGEGMKKYYDEIYPKFLDKYGKKWGARVGETSLGGQSLSNADIENKLTFTGSKIKTSDGKFWDDYDDAMRHEGSLTGAPTVRYLDVTPEMKASVSKGQPLFQALPAIPAGLLATQDDQR